MTLYLERQSVLADKLRKQIDSFVERMSIEMKNSVEKQLQLWLNMELQGETFSVAMQVDPIKFSEEFHQKGFLLHVDPMGEYSLYHNGKKLSAFKPQVNFSL